MQKKMEKSERYLTTQLDLEVSGLYDSMEIPNLKRDGFSERLSIPFNWNPSDSPTSIASEFALQPMYDFLLQV
jgi:hypothetical protein